MSQPRKNAADRLGRFLGPTTHRQRRFVTFIRPIDAPLRGTFLLLAVAMCACGDAAAERPPPLQDGEPCAVAEDCASGMCATLGEFGGKTCTRPCHGPADCKPPPGGGLACDKTGRCARPCEYLSRSGSTVCTFPGVYEECADQDPVEFCSACGCATYGGGACVADKGCVLPQPAGAACSVADECSSGLCDPETNQCSDPVGLGGACHYDVQCASGNCSNDGYTDSAGVCRVALGAPCTNDDCNMCVKGLCARSTCMNGVDCAPGWTCLDSISGSELCYQLCGTSSDCYNGSCQANGYCY